MLAAASPAVALGEEVLAAVDRIDAPFVLATPTLPFLVLVQAGWIAGWPRWTRALLLLVELVGGALCSAGTLFAVTFTLMSPLELLPGFWLLLAVHLGALATATIWGLSGLRVPPAVDAGAAGPADRGP